MQPAGSAPVDYWRLYRDGVPVMELTAEPDANGLYWAVAPAWPIEALYQLTAVNASGESLPSNAVALPEPGLPLSLGILVLCLWVGGKIRGR